METMQFDQPISFDAAAIPPDAPAGEWTGTCSVKTTMTKPDANGSRWPMLILNWTLSEAADAENESYVGSRVADFVTFYAEGHRNSKMAKQNLRSLLGALKIDADIIPTKLTSFDDLNPLVEALEGAQCSLRTVVVPNKRTNQLQTRINYPRAESREVEVESAAPKGKKGRK